MKTRKKWLPLLGLAIVLSTIAFFNYFSSRDNNEAVESSETVTEACQPLFGRVGAATPDSLKQQGKRLSRCIDKTYKSLTESNGLIKKGRGVRAIDSTVAPFLPSGISFEDAATVLAAAGFPLDSSRGTPYPCLSATKRLRTGFLFTSDVRIDACPKIYASNSGGGITRVRAVIETKWL